MKMFIKKIIILCLAFSLCFTALACENSTPHLIIETEFFTVNYSAEVINEHFSDGTIVGITSQTVEKGDDGSAVEAFPHYGYKFKQWSDGGTEALRQDKNIQANISVTATFEKLETFELNYNAGNGGRISGITKQSVPLGEDAMRVVAVPNEEYAFTCWSDEVKTAEREDKEITQGFTVTAYFTKQTLTLKYDAGDGGKIDGNATQSVICGGNAITITAMPNVGYKFIRWSDNNSTNPVRTDINVTKTINATAEFELVFEDGRGTEDKPILIYSYQEFLEIEQYSNLHYKLNSDLDLSGQNHMPLFNGANAISGMFNGIFDGNGHAIKNMKIDTYTNNPSLFGFVNKGIIKNLNITDFDIIVQNVNTAGGVICVGAAAAGSWGELNNIHTKGVIRGSEFTYDGVAIGGLVGQAGNIVKNCSANISIELSNITTSNTTATPFNIGGLIGVGFANVSDCETLGTIKVNQSHSDVFIGGLIGCFLVNAENVFEVKDCTTNIAITNGNGSIVNDDGSIAVKNGSYAKSGGLIGEVIAYGKLHIENCEVEGNIYDGGHAGGFISYAMGYGISQITITNSNVKNEITNASTAGFIYLIKNYSNSGKFEITNCYTKGNIVSNMAAGFCYMLAGDIRIYRCYSARNIVAQVGTAGFIQQTTGGVIEECFSTGTITVTYQASGFIFIADKTYVKNCYSISDIFITNTDADSEFRTFGCGMVVSAMTGINILNSYYSGKISGFVYTTSKVSGLGSIVGDFAGGLTKSQIMNCHLLYYEDTFATAIVVAYREPIAPIDLTVYNSIPKMSEAVDALNDGVDEPIWKVGENGLPQLMFVRSL